MGSEIALPVFGPIVLLAAIFFAVVAIKGRGRVTSEQSTLGLGRTRISLGYLGALLACVPVALWMSRDDARFKVENHYLTAETALRYQLGWALTFYFLITPFVLLLITVAGLPTLALLRRVRLASIVGVFFACLVVVVGISLLLGAPSGEDAIMCIIVAAGFAAGARLPLFRSSMRDH